MKMRNVIVWKAFHKSKYEITTSHLQDMIDLWIEVTLIHVIFQVLIGSLKILIAWKSVKSSSLKFNDSSVLPFLEKEHGLGLPNT